MGESASGLVVSAEKDEPNTPKAWVKRNEFDVFDR